MVSGGRLYLVSGHGYYVSGPYISKWSRADDFILSLVMVTMYRVHILVNGLGRTTLSCGSS